MLLSYVTSILTFLTYGYFIPKLSQYLVFIISLYLDKVFFYFLYIYVFLIQNIQIRGSKPNKSSGKNICIFPFTP